MTVPWLFNRCFYFYEDTPYRNCVCRNGDAIIRPSTDKMVLCASLKYFSVVARGGGALIILGTIKECVS